MGEWGNGRIGERMGERATKNEGGRVAERIGSIKELNVWVNAMDLAMEVFARSKSFRS